MRWSIFLALSGLALSLPALALDPEEERLQAALGHHAATPTKPAPAKPGPKGAKDPDAAYVGTLVRVITVERGLYVGTLSALDRDTVSLILQLPTRQVAYPLPRSLVARIEPL